VYENLNSGQWERASRELRAAFKKVVELTKKKCPLLKAEAEIYVGPGASALLMSGKARLGGRAGKVEAPFVLNDPRLAVESGRGGGLHGEQEEGDSAS
jgi:hypothetical protein